MGTTTTEGNNVDPYKTMNILPNTESTNVDPYKTMNILPNTESTTTTKTKYVVISHVWKKGFMILDIPIGQHQDVFLNKQPSTHSSVMFQSHDEGKSWIVYKKKS